MSNDPDLDPDLGLDLRNVILVTKKEVKNNAGCNYIASPCISTAKPSRACRALPLKLPSHIFKIDCAHWLGLLQFDIALHPNEHSFLTDLTQGFFSNCNYTLVAVSSYPQDHSCLQTEKSEKMSYAPSATESLSRFNTAHTAFMMLVLNCFNDSV